MTEPSSLFSPLLFYFDENIYHEIYPLKKILSVQYSIVKYSHSVV